MEIFSSAGYLNAWLRQSRQWVLFKERWPDWHIQFTDMPWVELFDWKRKIIWLDARTPQPVFRIAHAVAHLLYHPRGRSSRYVPREEVEADWYADQWLSWGLETPLPKVVEEAA